MRSYMMSSICKSSDKLTGKICNKVKKSLKP